jgi:hypothetical protein
MKHDFNPMREPFAVLPGLVGDNLATTLGYFDTFLWGQADGKAYRLPSDSVEFQEVRSRAERKAEGTVILGIWRLWAEDCTGDKPVRYVGVMLTAPEGISEMGHALFTYATYPWDKHEDGGKRYQFVTRGFAESDRTPFATDIEATAYAAGLLQGIAPSAVMDMEQEARQRYMAHVMASSILGALFAGPSLFDIPRDTTADPVDPPIGATLQ